MKANNIAINGRREFRGAKTIFIRDPDRNVLELVGPGPSVAELIKEHIHGHTPHRQLERRVEEQGVAVVVAAGDGQHPKA